tara:strand:+ start:1029 stop:1298 length:270 start_codon:yes stop_codon:yes gene_type:complete
MESFKSFITAAQKTKKCPDGYRFDKKLRVCVPIGVTRYYPYYGNGSSKQTDTSNDNGQNGNGQNGNGSNGNGASGDNNNTGNGNGGNGS